jgi:hypothetical protein
MTLIKVDPEKCLIINIDLARKIGTNEAALLHWISTKQEEQEKINKDPWVKAGTNEILTDIKIWSTATIKRTLRSLKEKSLIISENKNKDPYDRTLSYRVNVEKVTKVIKAK